MPRLISQRSRRLLDLFSGTGSVGSVYRAHGWQVVSLDIDPQWDATIQMDIRQWNFKQYPRDFFSAIFVAPTCTEYSTSMTARPRELAEANSLVRAALEIVRWFEVDRWILENPRYGLLRLQPCLQGVPFVDCDFCQFATYGYRKPTRFWGSPNVASLPNVLCDRRVCPNMTPSRDRHRLRLEEEGVSVFQKYRIPPLLIMYLSGWIDGQDLMRRRPFVEPQVGPEEALPVSAQSSDDARSHPEGSGSQVGSIDSAGSLMVRPEVMQPSLEGPEQALSDPSEATPEGGGQSRLKGVLSTLSEEVVTSPEEAKSILKNVLPCVGDACPNDIQLTPGQGLPEATKTQPKLVLHPVKIPTRLLESPNRFQVGAVMSFAPHTLQLLLRLPCVLPSGFRTVLDVLIDTGAQANLVRRGLFSNLEFCHSTNPISMITAGGVPLEGGREEVKVIMIFTASTPGGSGRTRTWKESAQFFDAAIAVEMIVGYPWLRSRHIGILPHLDALAMFDRDGLTTRILRSPSPTNSVKPFGSAVNSVEISKSQIPRTSDPPDLGRLPEKVNSLRIISVIQRQSPAQLEGNAACSSAPLSPQGVSLNRLRWCLRQIALGKSTPGYENYTRAVSVQDRDPDDPAQPMTPRPTRLMSKRAWTEDLRAWRRKLHLWDDPSRPKQTAVVRRLMDFGGGHVPFESYQVCSHIFQRIIHVFHVQPPDVDAFAESALHKCERWWGPGSEITDAFQVPDWGEHGLLWCNPPFSRLREVVSKLIRDQARATLIVPKWAKQQWYRDAQPHILQRMKFRRGSHVFETLVGRLPGVPWDIYA